MKLYWAGDRNFGDALNPFLYKRITGHMPERSEKSPKTLAIGSIISKARPSDTIWGTGAIAENSPISCKGADVRALRGPLTALILETEGIPTPGIYGDPALLLPQFFEPAPKEHTLGFFPHHRDFSKETPYPKGAIKIDAWGDTLEVLEAITACEIIISSSLHGIVVAEAYGIPAVWVELSDNVAGRGFKFRDYYYGTGRRPPEPLDWRAAPDWMKAVRRVANWQEPRFDADTLLNVCPFGESDV